jgi:tripartite motif-containing protein 71
MSDDTPVETEKTRRLLVFVVLIAFGAAVVLGFLATRKKPDAATPEAGQQEGARPPDPTPTPDPGEPPAFRETGSKDERPFAAARSPFEVKLDDQGRIWILDSANSRIRLFDREGGFLGGWGGLGSGPLSFKTPEGLAIAGNSLYVADTWNHRVSRYSLKGEWKGSATGFMGPRGVAVGPDGSVWVTDTGNHRVVKYDAALGKAQTVGPTGTDPGQFKSPVGIAISRSGLVYITDCGNGRIQILDKDGKYKASWSLPWLQKSWMARLAVGEDGTVYASDPGGPEVMAFDASGAPSRHWTGDDSGEKFILPEGLAIDRRLGILYVMDTGTHKVMTISLSGPKSH